MSEQNSPRHSVVDQKHTFSPATSTTSQRPGSPRTSTVPVKSDETRSTAQKTTSQSAVRIGPYVLGKTLGVGSTGRVKLGTHSETGHRVAVKIISKSALKKESRKDTSASAAESGMNRKLEREISIMKLIQHPSILSLYDVYESTEELFLIMELVEGGELFDYLVQRGRLKEMDALNFFQQIIAGVDYCHKHLICHRDLKPENLLLDSNKNLKIADFGMASVQPSGKLLETSCGSPHYASPEIIRGVKYNGQSADIWSCGVILYALLCGNLPFDDENIRRLLQKVKTGVFTIPESVPDDAADLIRRMLVVDPTKRLTIAEIEQHAWFQKKPYTWQNGGEGPLRNPPKPESLKPISAEQVKNGDIEADIIQSLTVLGYGNEETVMRALMSPESNYEKVFYWILCQRKSEVLAQYGAADLEQSFESTGGAHRRISTHGSRGSMFAERAASIFSSMNGNSTQNLSSGDNSSNASAAATVSPTSTMSPTSERKRIASEILKRRSYNKSPLSAIAVTPAKDVGVPKSSDGDGIFTNDLAHKAKEAALAALTGQRQIVAPSPKRSSLLNDVRKKLSMHSSDQLPDNATQSMPHLLAQQPNSKSNNNAPLKVATDPSSSSPSVQKQQTKSNRNSGQSTELSGKYSLQTHHGGSSASSPSVIAGGLQSPGVTSPKRSWFANLFHFKPQSFMLLAPADVTLSKARNALEAALLAVNVQFQPSADGVSLKCKYIDRALLDEAQIGESQETNASVKFKVTMNKTGGDQSTGSLEKESMQQTIELVCTQQQGSLAAFHQFGEQFHVEWVRQLNV